MQKIIVEGEGGGLIEGASEQIVCGAHPSKGDGSGHMSPEDFLKNDCSVIDFDGFWQLAEYHKRSELSSIDLMKSLIFSRRRIIRFCCNVKLGYLLYHRVLCMSSNCLF